MLLERISKQVYLICTQGAFVNLFLKTFSDGFQ